MKRFFGIIFGIALTLMVFSLAVSAQPEYVEVAAADSFKEALESDGDNSIVVTSDFIYTCKVSDAGDYWITLGKGEKTLNLNGKSVELNAETGVETTMIRVPAGANLTINDTSGDNSGKLFCYGRMESAYSEAMGSGMPEYFNGDVKYRNVLEIDGGTVTVNGGTLEAGRSKKMWVYDGKDVYDLRHLLDYTIQFGVLGLAIGARYDGYAWQQVNGDCITVNDGSLFVNDGIFLGRGFSNLETYVKDNDNDVDVEFSRSACLRLLGGNTVINGGEFHGRGNADVFAVKNEAGVSVKNGTFSTNHLRVLLVPTINVTLYGYWCPYVIGDAQRYGYQYHPASDVGSVRLTADMLDPDRNTVDLNGKTLPVSEWTLKTLTNTANEGSATIVVTHHMSNSDRRNFTNRQSKGTIDSAAILGTMAQGMVLDKNALTLSASNVRRMDVEWYHNGDLGEDNAEVTAGDYQAKITLYASAGYVFDENCEFAVMGYSVKDIEISENGRQAYVWSRVYSFDCEHSMNEDTSIYFDEETHYQICTVCGEKLAVEKHIFDGGVSDGGYIIYSCNTCDYCIEKADDGKVKIEYIDLRIANPEVGEKPDYYIAISAGEGFSVAETNDEYTENGVKWTKAGSGFEIGKDDLFTGGMWCRVHIYLDIQDGYSLSKNEKDEYNTLVYVNGSKAKYEVDGNRVTVYYEYTCDEVVVSSINLYDIDWPEAGNKPDCTVESEFPGYYGLKQDSGAVSWYEDGKYMDKSSEFEVGKRYSVELYVDAVRVGWDDVVKFGENVYATVNGITVREENVERLNDTAVAIKFTFPIVEAYAEFDDVDSSKYYYDAVNWAFENGITTGTGKTTFGPDESCTRGQVVTFLHRAAGCPEPRSDKNPFKDVKSTSYYYKAVLWAVEEGITAGTSVTEFSPDTSCSSAHIITFLYRAAGIGSDGWYEKAKLWAKENGYLEGIGLEVTPKEECTRGAVVTFLFRHYAR